MVWVGHTEMYRLTLRLECICLSIPKRRAGWQAHSVRGFLSTAAKKHSLQIESTKGAGGDRVYRSKK